MVLLLALALRFYLGRYEMVYNEHGTFLVGIDYVDQNIGLPLQWLVIFACLAAAVFVWMGRWLLAALMALALVVDFAAPRAGQRALRAAQRDLAAAALHRDAHPRHAQRLRPRAARARKWSSRRSPRRRSTSAAHKPLLDNVRLWDRRAFHDTVTQIQALRPYYVFADTDVDRYTIDGQYRQVLLAPRELDLGQLPAARANWINPGVHLHARLRPGAGAGQPDHAGRAARAADRECAARGEDASPEADASGDLLRRGDARAGVRAHRAEEFNYPCGRTERVLALRGQGRLPDLRLRMRLAAAIHEGEPNILLTSYLTPTAA